MILKAIRALYYIGGAERITDMRQLCVNMKGRDSSRVCLTIILHALLCDTIHTSEYTPFTDNWQMDPKGIITHCAPSDLGGNHSVRYSDILRLWQS